MTQTVFIRLDTLTARASKTGTVLPSIALTLCSAARLEFAFVDSEDVVGPLTGGSPVVKVCVKKRPNDEESLLLLTDCTQTGDGTTSRRVAEWSDTTMDNQELRDFLGGEISLTGNADKGPWMEVAITQDDKTDRVSFPITIKNAFLRPEDAAPNPQSDQSWPWLKGRFPDSGGFTHDDGSKTFKATPAWADVTGKPSSFTPSSHTHSISDVTGLQTALDGKAAASAVGANNGIAPLDSSGKVPAANLPSYVDDVIEAANLAALPATGEAGKLYVTLDTNKTYRWSGSAYVSVDEVPAFASQAEAEAGTNNTKLMTPLRTAQAIAALGGGGGGGASVPMGTRITGYWTTAPEGYLLCDGSYVGNSASGADEADDARHSFFLFLWAMWHAARPTDTFSDGLLKDSGGNITVGSGNAETDWTVGCRIQLPNEIFRTAVGASSAGALAGITLNPGAMGGEETHTLVESELPIIEDHSHAAPEHTHGISFSSSSSLSSGSDASAPNGFSGGGSNIGNTDTGGALNTSAAGGFGSNMPHNNVQPFIAVTVAIKY